MNKQLKLAAAVSSLLVAFFVWRPGNIILCDGFLPPNDMKIPVGDVRAKGIDEASFNAVLDRAQEIYGPIIAAKGGTLVINRNWSDPTVNAYANQSGDTWHIHMFGGLARHEAVTKDGFALVACHELGHHIGGFPKYSGMSWATNEGGADYYSTLKCLRRLLPAAAQAPVDPVAKAGCAAHYPEGEGRNRCESGTMAGVSVSALLAELGGDPKPGLSTPDPAVVSDTYDSHPAAQCRLDTYYQGALCLKNIDEDVADNSPGTAGACTAASGHKTGLRPLCWFKPPAEAAGRGVAELTSPRPDLKAQSIQDRLEALKSALSGRGI